MFKMAREYCGEVSIEFLESLLAEPTVRGQHDPGLWLAMGLQLYPVLDVKA